MVLTLILLCIFIQGGYSRKGVIVAQNVEAFFPRREIISEPPSEASFSGSSATGHGVIVVAVVVSALSTLLLSGLLFFCYKMFVGKSKEPKDENPLMGITMGNDLYQKSDGPVLGFNNLRLMNGDGSPVLKPLGGFRGDVSYENSSYSEENLLRKSHPLTFVPYGRDTKESAQVNVFPFPERAKQFPSTELARSPSESESSWANTHSQPPPPPPTPQFAGSSPQVQSHANPNLPPPPPPLPLPPRLRKNSSNMPPKANPNLPPPPPPLPLPPRLKKNSSNMPPKANPNLPPPPPPPLPTQLGKNSLAMPPKATPKAPPPPPKGSKSALPPLAPKAVGTFPRGSNLGPVKSAENSNVTQKDDGNLQAKLKPLHWDKLSANPDHSMVWDKLTEGSFRLDEDMIESLFGYNPEKKAKSVAKPSVVIPQSREDTQILDPRKCQNISIILRALNVTREEVCDALLEGDGLSTELLEKLVKITLTRDEERKLKDYKGDVSKLGPAERFIKALLDIPFAFKRFEAMLFRATFEEEMSFVKTSFQTMEAACTELRGTRLFMKLLEAVLKTGNRMNAGTNRGDAQAFNLNTLLKLADVKGTDGKTTLLHFVVKELVRSEGIRIAGERPNPSRAELDGKEEEEEEDEDYIRLGLQKVEGLGNELQNVKKAAGIDSNILANSVSKLSAELAKLREFLQKDFSSDRTNMGMDISGGLSFKESMESFVLQAEENISEIKTEEKRVFSLVTKITLYFHADAAKDKSQLLRIFAIVRDFLGMLEHVCAEIGRTHKKKTPKPVEKEAISPVTIHNHKIWQSPFLNPFAIKYDSSDDESVS